MRYFISVESDQFLRKESIVFSLETLNSKKNLKKYKSLNADVARAQSHLEKFLQQTYPNPLLPKRKLQLQKWNFEEAISSMNPKKKKNNRYQRHCFPRLYIKPKMKHFQNHSLLLLNNSLMSRYDNLWLCRGMRVYGSVSLIITDIQQRRYSRN